MKGYSPENCKWGTKTEQARNRPSFNRYITYKGRTQLFCDWVKELGIKRTTLRMRLEHGWSIERAFEEGVHNN